MKRTIVVSHGLKKRIMKVMNCTYPTVKKALEFESTTELACRIRKYAIQNGGKEYSINQ